MDFVCTSMIHSKVSVATLSHGIDEEHDELDRQVNLFEIETFSDESYTTPLDKTMPWTDFYFQVRPLNDSRITGDMGYTVIECTLTEYNEHGREEFEFPMIENRCPLNDYNGKMKSYGHRERFKYLTPLS